MKAKRAGLVLIAALMLLLSAAMVPNPAAGEPAVPMGKIENGVWRLDPSDYTYRTLQNTKELNLAGKGIRAVEGLEHLGALVSLDLSYNDLEVLDVSANTRLTELNCSDNSLSSLDISACRRLKVLNCSNNALGDLDVTSATNLQTLNCRDCGLEALDLRANSLLTELYCSGNELLGINVGHLKRLKVLDAANTGIVNLDVSSCGSLSILDCSSNPGLKELNLKGNPRLKELYTAGTSVADLDLTSLRLMAQAFASQKGYGYELTDRARIWRLEDGMLTANPEAAIRIGAGIVISPAGEDSEGTTALQGYLQFRPGEFSNRLLSSTYEEMCHYFRMTVGPSGSAYRKADEGWFYENAHTVVESAGLAVQARYFSTDKETSAARAFTVFDGDGNFKFRCTLEYMDNEDAVEFARRLNRDHEEAPEAADLRGYTGQVSFFVCGNALITMEGIPSAAQERTPTLESYLMSDPESPLYTIH